MKRIGNLFPLLVSWPNLVAASKAARRNKRFRPDVLRFEYFNEPELLRLRDELQADTYRPGAYRSFWIREPKLRLISAAPYRDRVVHHALCRVVEPIFEPTFVHDSYACRPGKGTHAAARRARELAKRYRFALQCDIEKFFPSVDHEVVYELFARKIKDKRVCAILKMIVDGANPQPPVVRYFPGDDLFSPMERRRGLPIGNQTSQFLANVMLNPLDHFVAERLKVGGYVRYCDDFILFGDDKHHLHDARQQIHTFLDSLRLRLHPHKSVVFPTAEGIPFLGYRIFPTHALLAKENVHRFRRRLRRLQREFARGNLTSKEVWQRIASWLGHASHAATFHLARKLLREHPFVRRLRPQSLRTADPCQDRPPNSPAET